MNQCESLGKCLYQPLGLQVRIRKFLSKEKSPVFRNCEKKVRESMEQIIPGVVFSVILSNKLGLGSCLEGRGSVSGSVLLPKQTNNVLSPGSNSSCTEVVRHIGRVFREVYIQDSHREDSSRLITPSRAML